MSEFKTLPLSKIHVPSDRSREVDNDEMLAIQASIVEFGLLTPILVRATPNGERPYTLVAGAHRYTAVDLLDEPEIDCLVFEGNKIDAAMAEVIENVFRNELSPLDRAISVQIYRDAWEQKNGKVKRGNPELSNSANLAELISGEAEKGFGAHCAERLGLSKRAVERANQIAAAITPTLRKKLRGTPIAHNQSQLEKIAKLEPKQRQKFAKSLDLSKGDFTQAMELVSGVEAPKPQTNDQKILSKLIDTWGRATPKIRRQFLEAAGLTKAPAKAA